MEARQKNPNSPSEAFHYKRTRLNQLFSEAMKFPLVTVCAGAGYGKTCAILDFLQEYQAVTVWMQLSEMDNINARFWENFSRTVAQVNVPFSKAIDKLGFPDSKEKISQYMTITNELVLKKQRVIIFDDFHNIENPAIIRFLEECLVLKMPPGTSVVLLSRSTPHINTAGLVSRGLMFNIGENDLRFTENELSQYFKSIDISLPLEHMREIMQDTEGWVFAINLIARSYQKAPGYGGYLRNAMKTNIFKLMEMEIWNDISEALQNFLIRLSLIGHLSIDLIALLAEDNGELIAELEKQNAYVRRDNYINAYLIHSLFLEFLVTKQTSLSEEEKRKTYDIAGTWCNKNGFKIDALSYFEKNADYDSIVSVLNTLSSQIPHEIANYASIILDHAPPEAFTTVEYLATMHLSTYICQGLWDKTLELLKYYEGIFLKMPAKDPFRKHALGTLYNSWGHLRALMSIIDDKYDFDIYFEKFCKNFSLPLNMKRLYNHCPGPWIVAVGTSKKGAPEEYIASLSRTNDILSKYFNGVHTGEDELAWGELKFYQGDYPGAETNIIRALEHARRHKQFEIIHRSLILTVRLGVAQGNYPKAEQALKEMKSQLDESQYINRYTNYDITIAWYYCILGIPESIPDWLKEGFSPYVHAAFTENFGNQMKAWYCYTTRNFPPVLSYIKEMKQRESFLFGRAEMLAMEACIHYKMKNKNLAFEALQEAYNTASPNDIIMPFIELGKDMRTLTTAALKESPSPLKIPKAWLENINRKSASFAKQQVHLITEYRKVNRVADGVTLSVRENEIFTDLSHGLSRSEIANNRGLSINTVKMVINNVYMKLGAENLADAIRIAAEQKIV